MTNDGQHSPLPPTPLPQRAGAKRKASGEGEESDLTRTLPWLVPLFVLLAWQIGSDLGVIQTNVLPAPSAVAAAGWRLARSGELCTNVEVSAARALLGFAIGGGIGFAFGMA